MKKIIGILSFLVLTISLQAQKFQVGDLYYTITSHTAPYTVEVSKLSSKSKATTLDIPETVDYNGTTYSVTSLGNECFKKCKSLTSVTIPNSIVSIGESSFSLCSSITSLTIPNSVTSIGRLAFNGCTSLTNIILPDGLSTIEWCTFCYCSSLKSILIPNSVSYIGVNAFSWSGIQSVFIPNSVTYIDDQAFCQCQSLTTISIPNSVTKIGSMSFSFTPLLKNIKYQGAREEWLEISISKDWNYASNFAISYQQTDNSFAQQPLLAQDKPQVPVVEKTPTTPTVTPTPRELISAVDKNIPQTHLKNENTFVVIIANENYEQVASVPYAINDGKIFRQYCEQALGIPSENIKLHTDATFNHTRLALSWLKDVCNVYKGDASVIFYYAGHGIPDVKDNSSYLLPADGDGRYVATAYKLDELYNTLGSMPAKSVVVFMDACFSGANRNGKMLASERGVAIKSRPGQPKGNMVVFSAAQGDETALPNDAEQHGMFTYYLLKKLQENQGNITLGELAEYLIREVGRRSVVVSKLQTPCVTPSASLDASWREWKLK